MCNDSRIRRSTTLSAEPSILKFSSFTELLHVSTWLRITEWGGLQRRDPVRKLLPACSATLVRRVRTVDPTYSDAQCAQLNWYTREDCMPLGRVSLNLNKVPMLKVFTNTILKFTLDTYLVSKWSNSDLSFSDWVPKKGRDIKWFVIGINCR